MADRPTIPGVTVDVNGEFIPVETQAAEVPNKIPYNPLSTAPDVNLLPIRGEKRVLSTSVSAQQASVGVNFHGGNIENADDLMDDDDFQGKFAKTPFKDYVLVRIPHRGIDVMGDPDPTKDAEFSFLINPATVTVNRETIDAQALSRAGWQFSVWGEGLVRISMSGTTAGQYFALGLTDEFQYYTKSYRNLLNLVMFFENNGYYWEGESAGVGPLAADFTRRRIRCHQDVQLIVGNFIWYGMFDSLSVQQNADKPFHASFDLSFVAWKERFRSTSPYLDSRHNDIQRGHSYDTMRLINDAANTRIIRNRLELLSDIPRDFSPIFSPQPPVNVNPNSTGVVAEALNDKQPILTPDVASTNYNDPMLSPATNPLFAKPWIVPFK